MRSELKRFGLSILVAGVAMSAAIAAPQDRGPRDRGDRPRAGQRERGSDQNQIMAGQFGKTLRQFGEAYKDGNREKARAMARKLRRIGARDTVAGEDGKGRKGRDASFKGRKPKNEQMRKRPGANRRDFQPDDAKKRRAGRQMDRTADGYRPKSEVCEVCGRAFRCRGFSSGRRGRGMEFRGQDRRDRRREPGMGRARRGRRNERDFGRDGLGRRERSPMMMRQQRDRRGTRDMRDRGGRGRRMDW